MKNGIKINKKQLSELLGCPVIETSALKKSGLKELIDEAVQTAKQKKENLPDGIFSEELEDMIQQTTALLPAGIEQSKKRWYAVKLLENDSKAAGSLNLPEKSLSVVSKLREAMEEKRDDDMESIVTDERYRYIQKIVSQTVRKGREKLTTSDKIDRIVTNRILGLPIFILVMWAVYYVSVTTVGTWMTDWTNDVFVVEIQNIAGTFLGNIGAGNLVTGLVVDGIIGGLGAVLGFVPQMAVLFLFLSLLEDCGYMVRIAFVMDRLFRHFGLSGKSFIPLLISSGCGIPGIMASRTIEQDNDRRLTIMTATFIPCGAKLPVIGAYGRGDRRRSDRIYRKFFHRAADVFYRDCSGACICYNIKEDKTFFRKTGSFCNGTAAVSYPAGEDRSSPCMGETERIYYKSRYDPFSCLCNHVVLRRIRIHRRKIRTCTRQCGQSVGNDRRSACGDLSSSWVWRVAAGCGGSFGIYGKRSDRIYDGSACKCIR